VPQLSSLSEDFCITITDRFKPNQTRSSHFKLNVLLMKPSSLIPFALTAMLMLAGCGNPPGSSVYVDPNGPRTIANVGKINIQDFNNAASDAVQDMLSKNPFAQIPQQPAVLSVSRITNDTDQQFDTDLLTKNIRIALINGGKVAVLTTNGLNGNAEDTMARDAGNQQAFMGGQPAPVRLPDFVLTGKILMDKSAAGNTKQNSYVFQLTLTNVKTGLSSWEYQKTITKQGQSSSIGW